MSDVDYHGLVRNTSAETSWLAAGKQSRRKVDLVKTLVLSLLATYGPQTDEELFGRYEAYIWVNPKAPKVTPQAVRTRRHALVVEGKVVDTGRTGRTQLGNKAVIWDLSGRPFSESPSDSLRAF